MEVAIYQRVKCVLEDKSISVNALSIPTTTLTNINQYKNMLYSISATYPLILKSQCFTI